MIPNHSHTCVKIVCPPPVDYTCSLLTAINVSTPNHSLNIRGVLLVHKLRVDDVAHTIINNKHDGSSDDDAKPIRLLMISRFIPISNTRPCHPHHPSIKILTIIYTKGMRNNVVSISNTHIPPHVHNINSPCELASSLSYHIGTHIIRWFGS